MKIVLDLTEMELRAMLAEISGEGLEFSVGGGPEVVEAHYNALISLEHKVRKASGNLLK